MNNEPYGMRTASGAEAISDDREMKFILRREISFNGAVEQEVYTAYCYVKDGTGWEKTSNSGQYASTDAFIRAVGRFPGFLNASRELNQEKTD